VSASGFFEFFEFFFNFLIFNFY